MAATATHHHHHHIHDPFSPHHTAHYSPAETTALLELLAVDNLIDSHAPHPAAETTLLNDLLAVDLEFNRVDIRDHSNVATAPALKDEKDLFLDLLKTDQEVDGAKGCSSSSSSSSHDAGGGQHYATSRALHDPYGKKEYSVIEQFTGIYYAGAAAAAAGNNNEEQQLRDNVVMMHLLAMDESVDHSKRYQKLIESNDYAIIGELYEVDVEVSGAKRRALLVEDLQGLLDVDHLVDGVVKKEKVGDSSDSDGGKRSIFSVKEKYTAKVANSFSA